ncbi:MAG: transposase [Porticoccaceae bacterium]|nr:transposase [Porticoccaceae bacterium]
MVNYRRNFQQGGCYFLTLILHDRTSALLVKEVTLLREAFAAVNKKHPFLIDAISIMPDHLHLLMQLPEGCSRYPLRVQQIKAAFTRSIKSQGACLTVGQKGQYKLWQSRYWEHTIRDERDWQNHVDYIHFNPVKHGLVARVADWPYSSFHRFVRKGLLPEDWGGQYRPVDGVWGE